MKNIFLIPTATETRVAIKSDGFLFLTNHPYPNSPKFANQNIYITNDEVPKLDEYGINTKNNVVFKSKGFTPDEYDKEFCRKIILTTDQDLIKDGVQAINDEFLEWLVDNPNCEEVDVWINKFYGNKKEMMFNVYGKYKILIPNLEIWKDVPEFEGYYQVSNLGNVKSLSRTILGRGKHNTLLKERILKFSTSTNGYYQVILQKEGFKKIYKVHSLVAICFLNHTPDGTHNVVIDHINEVKTDNRLENLRLIGHRENVSRSMKNNTSTYVGVSWSKNAKKWISQITIEGKTKYLGLFDNEEDANKKYLETLKDL